MCASNRSGHCCHRISLATGVGPARGRLLADTGPPRATGVIRAPRLSLGEPTAGVPRADLRLPGNTRGKGPDVLGWFPEQGNQNSGCCRGEPGTEPDTRWLISSSQGPSEAETGIRPLLQTAGGHSDAGGEGQRRDAGGGLADLRLCLTSEVTHPHQCWPRGGRAGGEEAGGAGPDAPLPGSRVRKAWEVLLCSSVGVLAAEPARSLHGGRAGARPVHGLRCPRNSCNQAAGSGSLALSSPVLPESSRHPRDAEGVTAAPGTGGMSRPPESPEPRDQKPEGHLQWVTGLLFALVFFLNKKRVYWFEGTPPKPMSPGTCECDLT